MAQERFDVTCVPRLGLGSPLVSEKASPLERGKQAGAHGPETSFQILVVPFSFFSVVPPGSQGPEGPEGPFGPGKDFSEHMVGL